jgi:hypothetical protein
MDCSIVQVGRRIGRDVHVGCEGQWRSELLADDEPVERGDEVQASRRRC